MKKKRSDAFPFRESMQKIIRVMKLVSFFLLVGFLQVSANIYSQTANIKLSMQEVALSDVIKEIQKQTEFTFFYSPEDVTGVIVEKVELEKASLEKVLDLCLKGTNLDYEIVHRAVILRKDKKKELEKEFPVVLPVEQPQKKNLKGKVTDTKGEPVPGTTVVVTGTTIGTITDGDGNFTLDVLLGTKTLSFSFVGYKAQEIPIGNKTIINVTLAEETVGIEEVVAVGYGTVRKSDLTGAVSSIKVGEDAKERSIVSASDLIYGKTAGVQIFNNSGIPGSEITFNIRGISSFSNNEPLIVIDGMPVDAGTWGPSTPGGAQRADLNPNVNFSGLANLNPNDIESIEILKDASSMAIYGSRAANGVVLITTKSGKIGKDKIEYNFNMSSTKVIKRYEVLNSKDYMDFYNEASINDGLTTLPYPNDSVYAQRIEKNSNWQDLIFQEALSYDHQLSLTGGDMKNKYAIIANYSSNEGIILTSTFDKGGLRFNFDREVTKNLKLSLRANYSAGKSNAVPHTINGTAANISVISSALNFRPFDSAFVDDGDGINDGVNNPLTLLKRRVDIYNNKTLISNLSMEYAIFKGLTFKFNGGFNSNIDNRDNYYGRETLQGANAPNGYATVFDTKRSNYLTEYTLNLNRKFGKSRLNAFIGYSWQEWNNRRMVILGRDFPDDATLYYNFELANAVDKPRTSFSTYALASYIGRAVYSFDNRYALTITGRYDGSTRLSEGNKWSFFPSVGAGWNIHNERFMKQQKLLSTLKLRTSWGVTGNQSISPGSSQSILTTNRAVFGNGLYVGYLPGRFENPYLGWEITNQWNWGVDLGFLEKNRFTLSVDYYIKSTRDQLGNYPLPGSSGYTSYATNLGEIKNSGIELEASANILVKKFKWNMSGNISFNRNKILSLGDLTEMTTAQNTMGISVPLLISKVGQPIFMFQGYKVDGVYQNQEEVDNGPTDEVIPNEPGHLKFVDTHKDGLINAKDIVILGSPFPDFVFGVSNTLSYKGLTLDVLVSGSIGQKIANLNRHRLDGLVAGMSWNTTQEAYDGRWTGEGTSNTYPKATTIGNPFKGRFTDFLLEDGSYIKIKSAVLAYELPIKRFNINIIDRIKVFASSTNLLTFTKYKGYDPEISGLGSTRPGIDSFTAPQGRTFTVGFNVVFN